MRLVVSSTRPPLAHLLSALLLVILHSHTVLSQTFLFNLVTDSLPWSPRPDPGALLTPLSADYLLYFGASNGETNNDVWLSVDRGLTWTIQSGRSETGDAPGIAANQSFPATAQAMLAYDPISEQGLHFGGFNLTDDGSSTDTYYSPDGVKWAQAAYAADSPTPTALWLPGTLVTLSSDTQRDPSFLLLGGTMLNLTASTQVWKSSAVANQPGVRQWSVVGSTVSAAGSGFIHVASVSAVLIDRARLDGRDILYALDVSNPATGVFTDAIWASSDEGATWVQLAASSFGLRNQFAAAVTDSGVLFVLGGTVLLSNLQRASLSDMWASFDGGYTWSLCTNTLPPRSNAVMAYNSYTQQLMYGMGFNISADGFSVPNDLYTADVSDVYAIADACGTTVPTEGVGLTRWPGIAPSSSSTGAAASGSSSSSSGRSSSGSAISPSSAAPPTASPSTAGPSPTSSIPIIPTVASSSTTDIRSSSSSSTGLDSGNDDSSSSNGLLIALMILFAALSTACAALAYTQYRLRVYGTVCCEWFAGVTCGQLCGDTVGWGTKWQRRSNLSDAELLRQVASDRYD